MKGFDYINKKISTDKNINIKIVEKINKFYWKEGVKEKLSDLESGPVYIKGIGTISVSYYKLKNAIKHLIGLIRSVPRSTKFTEETKTNRLFKFNQELKRMLKKRNELANQYYKENLRNGRYPRIFKINSEGIKESRTDN